LLLCLAHSASAQIIAFADFSHPRNQNAYGQIIFTQQTPNEPTTFRVQLVGSIGSGKSFGEYHVHQFPLDDSNPNGPCSVQAVGGHFNPNNGVVPCNPAAPNTCEVGDLSGKFGVLPTSVVDLTFVDPTLSLSGPNSIVGKSLVVHDAGGNRWICASIVTPQFVAVADFSTPRSMANYAYGQFTFIQATPTSPTTVAVNLVGSVGTGKSFGEYHIHEFLSDDSNPNGACSVQAVGGHFNPNNGVLPCNPAAPNTCEVGDLSGKFGVLTSSFAKTSFVDPTLKLSGPNSIFCKSLVVHDSNGARWICADIQPIIGGSACNAPVPVALQPSSISGSWRQSPSGGCSVTCGQGVKSFNVFCADASGKEITDPVTIQLACGRFPKPAASTPCSAIDCAVAKQQGCARTGLCVKYAVGDTIMTQLVAATVMSDAARDAMKLSSSTIGDPKMFGTFVGGTFGIKEGIIISTGDVEKLNDEQQELSTDYKPLGPDGDTATLLVRFQLQETLFLSFNWIVASRELPKFGGSAYNDKFVMEINGNPIATLSSGKVVSINNLVPYPQTPSEWSSDYIDNPNREYFGYTGYTKLLVASGQATVGQNTLNVSVIDVSDGLLDTVVFIQGGSLKVTTQYYWNPLPWSTCQPACGPKSIKSRALQCMGSDGKPADESKCANSEKPAITDACADAPPCHYDYGPFGPCTGTCQKDGEAPPVRARQGVCKGPSNEPVSDTFCDQAQAVKTEPCTGLPTCPKCDWSPWSACSASCGTRGSRTRSIPQTCQVPQYDDTGTCAPQARCPPTCVLPATLNNNAYDWSACQANAKPLLLADCKIKCAVGYACVGTGCSGTAGILTRCEFDPTGGDAPGVFDISGSTCVPTCVLPDASALVGYDTSRCNSAAGPLSLQSCIVACGDGAKPKGDGPAASCDPPAKSGVPQPFTLTGCEPPYTAAPTGVQKSPYVKLAEVTVFGRAGGFDYANGMRKKVFLGILTQAFSLGSSTPYVVLNEFAPLVQTSSTLTTLRIGVLPDFRNASYVQQVASSLRSIARTGVLDASMKQQSFIIKGLKGCANDACTTDIPFSNSYFYPGSGNAGDVKPCFCPSDKTSTTDTQCSSAVCAATS